MATTQDDFLLQLLDACAQLAPTPLYPAKYAKEQNLDRERLDEGLDELRRRGLMELTEWVKDLGQGRALTDAGEKAQKTRRLERAVAPVTQAAAEPMSVYERGENVRRAIFDPAPAYVARLLLFANILYFCYGAFYAWRMDWIVQDYLQGEGRTTSLVLSDLGALNPRIMFSSVGPQLERILLSAFLHIGVFHLFMNMLFLLILGRRIEGLWGSSRFLAIYFVSAVVSGCVVLLINRYQNVPLNESPQTAGASGCMFGIFVAMIVWFSLNYEHLPDRLIESWSQATLFNVFLLVAINFWPGVSWQGHFGGAVGGLLAALLLHMQRFHPSRFVRWLALAGVVAVPVAFVVAVLWQAGRL